VPRKLLSRYRGNLQKLNDDIRAEAAEELLKVIPESTEALRLARLFIKGTRSRQVGAQDIYESLATIRRDIKAPLGIVLHNFHYMPDGRPVVWPPDFNQMITDAADRLGIPVLDPAVLVEQHGVQVALAEDLRHWSSDFFPTVADRFQTFIGEIGVKPQAEAAVFNEMSA